MSTLLQKFISDKVATYTEPTRKRVPKGHKIGFPRSKFHAALLCLTVSKGAAIAAQVGVKHTQIRVWKTEPGFKLMVKKNAEEFAGVFVDYLIEKGKQSYWLSQALTQYIRAEWDKKVEGKAESISVDIKENAELIPADLKGFLESIREAITRNPGSIRVDIKGSNEPPAPFLDLADSGSYQPFLIILIVEKLLTVKVPKEIESQVHQYMWSVLRTFGHDKAPGLKDQVLIFKRSVERVLDEAMQLVLKPKLTDGDRSRILMSLTTLKSIL